MKRMSSNTLCKTVRQYNKNPIPKEDMQKLQEIAFDYSRVKNYVYQRYGGITGISKIYPGYTVQNEMTESGFRAQLGLPSVYFYLAIFDALGDIKCQWTQTQTRIQKCIKENLNLTEADRHYLRFVMKMSECFQCILLQRDIVLSQRWQDQYDNLKKEVDTHRLHQYLRRQVRKHLKKLHTDTTNGFSIAERAYRYDDHGIYISIKEKRKRIFIPLTDNNHYKKQLYVVLQPEEGNIEIRIPVEVEIQQHTDYNKEIGLAVGIQNMFVTDNGTVYGELYGEYQKALTDYVRQGLNKYRRNKKYNAGRKKYQAQKSRIEAKLHTYINTEINRMLATEKPAILYIPKLPQANKAGINRKINQSVSMWQRGYVRSRLAQKCKEHSIELVEVYGKNIAIECSNCGAIGQKNDGLFICATCGIQMPDRKNVAQNVRNRGKLT